MNVSLHVKFGVLKNGISIQGGRCLRLESGHCSIILFVFFLNLNIPFFGSLIPKYFLEFLSLKYFVENPYFTVCCCCRSR